MSHSDTPENGQDESIINFDAAQNVSDVDGAIGATAAEETGDDEATRVAQAMEALSQENADLKDKLMRAVAEQENLRRRFEREKEDLVKFAGANFAKQLLGAIDNMERAIASVPPEAREEDGIMASLLTGVEATARELVNAFEKSGIERLDPIDERFDPNKHEVMFEVEGTGKAPGTIVQILQSGFVMNGRLLRPARVGVAKGEAGGASLNTEV